MWNKLELNSKKIIDDFTKNKFSISDFNFTNLYLWSFGEDTKYKIEDDILLIKSIYNNKKYYYMPIPREENQKTLSLIKEKIKKIIAKKIPIFYFSEYWKKKLENDFEFIESRASFDYIYSIQDLVCLKGRKYSKKKNRINKFLKNYSYTYEKISKNNIQEIIDFQKEWNLNNNANNEEILRNENEGILSILENYFFLDLKGGLLKVENKVVAYTIGGVLDEKSVVIYIEKALIDYVGAYQFINMKFLQEEFLTYEFVNREDDFGIEGLREAKLSYHPLTLLKKFNIS